MSFEPGQTVQLIADPSREGSITGKIVNPSAGLTNIGFSTQLEISKITLKTN